MLSLVERLRGAARGLCSEDAQDYIPRGISAQDCIVAADVIEKLEGALRDLSRFRPATNETFAYQADGYAAGWNAAISGFQQEANAALSLVEGVGR